ncbi:MAG: lipopolysaccharide kinase InaA family protein [Gemmataceae bacterium]|nr:lipopolysaccharide kinase InaA family protein [Gemmataceae bacterium]
MAKAVKWFGFPSENEDTLRDIASAIEEGHWRESARLVKRGSGRSVFRMNLQGLDFHLKLFHARPGILGRLAQAVRGPAARREHLRLCDAASYHLGVPRSLGFGVVDDGSSYLLTETCCDSLSLQQYLESRSWDDPGQRQKLCRDLGRFLAKVHVAGLRHDDLHPGNILVQLQADGTRRFLLLDLGAARWGVPLSRRETIRNLALLNRWFVLRTHRTDRRRCWGAYVAERARLQPDWQPTPTMPAQIEAQADAGNHRLWKKWAYRCLRSNRRFEHHSVPSGEVFRVSDFPWLEEVSAWCGPTPPITAKAVLKHSPSSWVAVLDLGTAGGRRAVIVKWMRGRGRWRRILDAVMPSPDRRAWMNGHRLRDCLVPTPRPLLLYRSSDGRGSILLTDYLDRAIPLPEALFTTPPTLRRQRIEAVARLIRTIHQRGWVHRDLKASNLLWNVDSAGQEIPWIIDLAGAWRPIRISHARRYQNLARLNASFLRSATLTRTDRLRFLRTYLAQDWAEWRNWKSWWRAIARATERKRKRNELRERPLG